MAGRDVGWEAGGGRTVNAKQRVCIRLEGTSERGGKRERAPIQVVSLRERRVWLGCACVSNSAFFFVSAPAVVMMVSWRDICLSTGNAEGEDVLEINGC